MNIYENKIYMRNRIYNLYIWKMKEKIKARRISSGFKNIFNRVVRYSGHEFETKLPRNEITNFEMPTDK